MAVNDQSFEAFANNVILLEWAKVLADDGVSTLDLTGRTVKFALARLANGEPIRADPLLDLSSADASPQVVIPNPIAGSPHVQVQLDPADTIDLAPVSTAYYIELEVFDAGDLNPVVVATGTLTIKPNVDNA